MLSLFMCQIFKDLFHRITMEIFLCDCKKSFSLVGKHVDTNVTDNVNALVK